MQVDAWLMWLVIAAICIVGEIFTTGFFLMWFGVAAAISAILAYIGVAMWLQWVVFIIISTILILVSRQFADRITKQQKGIGANRFVGKCGVVVEMIDNLRNTGKVRVEKEIWRAENLVDGIIPEGSIVDVVKIEGTHLIVKMNKKVKQNV